MEKSWGHPILYNKNNIGCDYNLQLWVNISLFWIYNSQLSLSYTDFKPHKCEFRSYYSYLKSHNCEYIFQNSDFITHKLWVCISPFWL